MPRTQSHRTHFARIATLMRVSERKDRRNNSAMAPPQDNTGLKTAGKTASPLKSRFFYRRPVMALSTLSRQSLSTLRSTAVALTLAAAAPLAFAQTGPTVAPTGITTSNVTATSVDVSWTAIAANAWGNDGGGNDYAPGDATSKYTACADTVSPTTPVCVDSANGTTTTATITPLTAGTEYVITVKAVSAGGDGSEGAAGSNITTTAAQETAPATPAWGSLKRIILQTPRLPLIGRQPQAGVMTQAEPQSLRAAAKNIRHASRKAPTPNNVTMLPTM